MNKEINYLIEYLAKSNDIICAEVLSFFTEHYIYIPTKYELKTIKILASKSGVELDNAEHLLNEKLKEELNKTLIQAKEQLFETLIKTNFKKKKEQFDKVETSIFKCLSSYIVGITRAFDIFYVYTKKNQQKPELFIEFANILHVKLVNSVFNKEEKELLEDKLKEVMSVYLALYAKFLYT